MLVLDLRPRQRRRIANYPRTEVRERCGIALQRNPHRATPILHPASKLKLKRKAVHEGTKADALDRSRNA